MEKSKNYVENCDHAPIATTPRPGMPTRFLPKRFQQDKAFSGRVERGNDGTGAGGKNSTGTAWWEGRKSGEKKGKGVVDSQKGGPNKGKGLNILANDEEVLLWYRENVPGIKNMRDVYALLQM